MSLTAANGRAQRQPWRESDKIVNPKLCESSGRVALAARPLSAAASCSAAIILPQQSSTEAVIGLGGSDLTSRCFQPADANIRRLIEIRDVRLDVQERRTVQDVHVP